MAVKLADTLAPMGDFEIAKAKDVSIELTDGSTSDVETVLNGFNDSLVDIEKKVIEHYADDINIDTKEGTWDADFSSTVDNTHGTFPVKGMWTKVVQEESNFFRKQIATLFDSNGRVRSYERGKWINDGGTWSAWQELATMDKVDDKIERRDNPTEVNLDKLLTTARYSIGSTAYQNIPTQSVGVLIVENAQTYTTQMYITDNETYIRLNKGKGWYGWQKLSQ